MFADVSNILQNLRFDGVTSGSMALMFCFVFQNVCCIKRAGAFGRISWKFRRCSNGLSWRSVLMSVLGGRCDDSFLFLAAFFCVFILGAKKKGCC